MPKPLTLLSGGTRVPPQVPTASATKGAARAQKGMTMAWRIAGSYVATCSCNLICPVSEQPDEAPARRA